LGASGFIGRDDLTGPVKPLGSQRWAGAIDVVGGVTLANILSTTRFNGVVAATGLTGGADLPTTVHPFILRGVTLAGINSVHCPKERRIEAWTRLAALLPDAMIDAMTETIPLAGVPKAAEAIVAGRVKGRLVVDVRA
jgi:acrylyl-CoA reductase (NADPH)